MQERFYQVFHANFQVTIVVVIVIAIPIVITSYIDHSRREDPDRHVARARDFAMSKPNIDNNFSHHAFEGG